MTTYQAILTVQFPIRGRRSSYSISTFEGTVTEATTRSEVYAKLLNRLRAAADPSTDISSPTVLFFSCEPNELS